MWLTGNIETAHNRDDHYRNHCPYYYYDNIFLSFCHFLFLVFLVELKEYGA